MNLRVGTGYDLHRLAEGRPLIVGCVAIPGERGLVGHSDGDVAAHAIADALLGAAALGDLGEHFPPGDPQYAGISGRSLLDGVRTRLEASGWRIVNVDVTIVTESPRLAPYRGAMREALALALGVTPEVVGVKAKTNEGLDAIGRGEAIAAHAVALLATEGA